MTALRSLGARIGTVGLGAITLAAIVAITLIFYLGIWQGLVREKGREVTVDFARSAQLKVGDPVKVDGVEEGQVTKIENLPEGRGARVTLDVLDSAGPIHEDARADLRWRILLGASFFVDLDTGTPGRPVLGSAPIPVARTSQQVELDDVSTIFRDDARRGVRTLPGELAMTLEDPEAPARAFETLTDSSPSVDAGLGAARGTPGRRSLSRLVAGTASTVRALDAPDDQLRVLVAGAGATLETVARRNAELRAAIDAGPRTMTEIDTTLARLEPTLTGADGLVARLDRSAADVAPTLSALRPTLVDTADLVDRATPLLAALDPALSNLGAAARTGVPVIDELQPSLRRLDEVFLPYMARKDPETGKSTTVMIGGTAAGFGGSAGPQDPNGHLIRFPASGGESSAYLPCRTALTDPSQQELAVCDSLQDALSNYLNYFPGTPGQEGELPGSAP